MVALVTPNQFLFPWKVLYIKSYLGGISLFFHIRYHILRAAGDGCSSGSEDSGKDHVARVLGLFSSGIWLWALVKLSILGMNTLLDSSLPAGPYFLKVNWRPTERSLRYAGKLWSRPVFQSWSHFLPSLHSWRDALRTGEWITASVHTCHTSY